MLAPAAQYVLYQFSEFWHWAKTDPAADAWARPQIHRVSQRWRLWWETNLSPADQERFRDSVSSLVGCDRSSVIEELRRQIEADREQEQSPQYGRRAADWVFMQLASVEPFNDTGTFDSWRLDREEGYRLLIVEPPVSAQPDSCEQTSKHARSRRIRVALLNIVGPARPYTYNVSLRDPQGVSNALEAVARLLSRPSPRFLLFNGRPRGWRHHPILLRSLLAGSLLVGAAAVATLYLAGRPPGWDEEMLVAVAVGASAVFLTAWLIGSASDWLVEARLASLVRNRHLGWALSDIPQPDRVELVEVDGDSYGAALSLATLHEACCHYADDCKSWIVWCVHAAATNMSKQGITGRIAADGSILSVEEMTLKKKLCIDENVTCYAPNQQDAVPTQAEASAGLQVETPQTLEALVWRIAGFGSGVMLWIGATAALLLVGFSISACSMVRARTPPVVVVRDPPLDETVKGRTPFLLIRFLTKSPQDYQVRIRSRFWQSGEYRLVRDDAETAHVHVDLIRAADANGSATAATVQVLQIRRVPFLTLPPVTVIEMSFERLVDMYQRSKGLNQ